MILKNNFFNNVNEDITLDKSVILKKYWIQNNKSSGYFYKYSKNKINKFKLFIFYFSMAGLKFNKLDLEFDLEGEKVSVMFNLLLF